MKLRSYALLVSLAALGLVFAWHRERSLNAGLAGQLSDLARENAELRFQAKETTRRAAEVGQRAVELDAQLGSAKTRVTVTESKQVQLSRELHETKSRLTDREQREVALMAELATLRQKLGGPDGAGADAAPLPPGPGTGPRPSDDVSTESRIADLERLLAAAPAEPRPAAAPEVQAAPHQVVRVGPRNAFVVLDYGREQGARLRDILSLRRGTESLARVQISEIRPRFSLAQVLPGTLKGQLQTGDLAVFKK